MHDVGDLVLLDRLQDARHVENVAELDIDLVDDVADQAFVPMTREDDGAVPLLDEFAACLGADDAHSAGDEYLHAPPPDSSIDPVRGDPKGLPRNRSHSNE